MPHLWIVCEADRLFSLSQVETFVWMDRRRRVRNISIVLQIWRNVQLPIRPARVYIPTAGCLKVGGFARITLTSSHLGLTFELLMWHDVQLSKDWSHKCDCESKNTYLFVYPLKHVIIGKKRSQAYMCHLYLFTLTPIKIDRFIVQIMLFLDLFCNPVTLFAKLIVFVFVLQRCT